MISRLRVPATGPCPFVAGHTYRRKILLLPGMPTIRVIGEPTRERLGSVTQRGAQEEGYRDRQAWRAAWVRRHDRWRGKLTASDAECVARFLERHMELRAWSVRFVIVEPSSRLLAEQRSILVEVARRGTRMQLGLPVSDADEYTTGKTIDREASAVDAAVLEQFAEAAASFNAQAQARHGTARATKAKRNARRDSLFG